MQTIKDSLGKEGFTTEIQRHRVKRNWEPTKRSLEPIRGVEREVRRRGLKADCQAELGTKVGNHLKRSRVGKRRPSGTWNQYCEIESTAFGGYEAGKFTGSYHMVTASYRLMSGLYRPATGFCRLICEFYRLLPGKSTQVVDFPHICVARLFGEGLKMIFQGQAKRGTTYGDTEKSILSLWSSFGSSRSLL